MIDTPRTHTNAPIQSYMSGAFLSIPHPHKTDKTINTPPYAAYTLPNVGKFCKVGMIPYTTRMMLPSNPYQKGFDSLSQSQMR